MVAGLLILMIFVLGLVIVCSLLAIEIQTQKKVNEKLKARIYTQFVCKKSE